MSFAEFRADLARRHVDENLVALARVDSTQRFARDLVDRLDARCPSLTVLAWDQYAGRGRLGKRWASPAGRGVYASMVRHLAREHLLAAPLLTGVALARAVRRVTGLEAALKWPNDVLVGGKKLGGILIESVVRPASPMASVVIGFGLNVGHALRELPGAEATSVLLETGAAPPLAELTAAAAAAVDEELLRAGEEGYAARRFSELMVHRIGEPLTCRMVGETVSGELAGFDRRGLLRLRVAGHERLLAAAELADGAAAEPAC